MHRLPIAAIVTVALVGATSTVASADPRDGDSVCTVTLQLPATATPGGAFTLHVLEDSDCVGLVDGPTFSWGGLLTTRSAPGGDAGIHFDHTLGTGNFSYQGIAPAGPEYYTPFLNWQGAFGGDGRSSTMQVTWATPEPSPTPTPTATPTAEPTPTPTATPTPTPPPSKPSEKRKYKNCTQVHKYWTGGIAKAGVTVDKRKGAKSRPLQGEVLHSNVAYKVNKKLDRDKDGVACEHS